MTYVPLSRPSSAPTRNFSQIESAIASKLQLVFEIAGRENAPAVMTSQNGPVAPYPSQHLGNVTRGHAGRIPWILAEGADRVEADAHRRQPCSARCVPSRRDQCVIPRLTLMRTRPAAAQTHQRTTAVVRLGFRTRSGSLPPDRNAYPRTAAE